MHVRRIEQVRIDPGTGQLAGDPRRIWSGTPGARFPEAPHLYRIGDYWYLLIAEGGTERGHGAVAPVMTAPPWPCHPVVGPPARDDFDQARLHPRRVSVRSRPAGHCSTEDRPGWLTLRARGESIDDPDVTFVGRRQQHLSCRARTLADAAEGRGGLAVRLDERHHYAIEVADGEVRVAARIGPLRQIVGTQPAPSGPVLLRIDAHASPAGLGHPLQEPDLLSFGTEDPDGVFTVLAELDGRYLSTQVAGGFTGRVIGLYAAQGTVRFDWFDYEPIAEAQA